MPLRRSATSSSAHRRTRILSHYIANRTCALSRAGSAACRTRILSTRLSDIDSQVKWESLISAHVKDSVACVFLCDTEHGLGQHYCPDDNLQQCLCAQIYGERNYKDLGYLQEVKHICTDEEKAERRKRAEAMKSRIVFGKITDKDRAEAQQLWEQNGRRASWGCAWFQKWFDRVG